MAQNQPLMLSIVVPLYNESAGLRHFHDSLIKVAENCTRGDYEIIYCDDGSSDETAELVRGLSQANHAVKLIKFSRNFGKENALTAGIAESRGSAILSLDGDGQHPVELIPQFVEAWKNGAQVVVGVRNNNAHEGWFKRLGSKLFYQIFNQFTSQEMLAGSTDFRLIDREVQQAFLTLKEADRITRGLIDWLGFRRQLIYFDSAPREFGTAGYSRRKLIGLATNSFLSLTLTPLYIFGYLGIVITFGALVLGVSVIIEQLIMNDPWHWKFTGTAMLGILILFLVGIILMSQGVISLYISRLQNQSKHRPLYVIDHQSSVGIKDVDAE